jgi:hypothetical protein
MLARVSTLPCPSAPQPVKERDPTTSKRIVAKSLPFVFVAVYLLQVCTCS